MSKRTYGILRELPGKGWTDLIHMDLTPFKQPLKWDERTGITFKVPLPVKKIKGLFFF